MFLTSGMWHFKTKRHFEAKQANDKENTQTWISYNSSTSVDITDKFSRKNSMLFYTLDAYIDDILNKEAAYNVDTFVM